MPAVTEYLRPDLIALTGDYISQDRAYAAPCAEVVGKLRARHGVYAVLGNHDYESGKEQELMRMMSAEGIKVLDGSAYERDGVGFAGMQAGPAGQDLGPLAKPRLNDS